MNKALIWGGACIWCVGGSAAPRAVAENPTEVKAEVYKMWDVDSMILQAADNVARRYNLDKQQTEFTRKMMVERVTRFLEENQEQIWPLVRDLARYQLSGAPPDENTAKRIGAAALPIVDKARKAILDGNEEWGAILSEEQKGLHDHDLREMRGTFEKVTQNFEEWKTGKPVPNPIFPHAEVPADEPPTPARPADKYTPPERKRAVQEGSWAKYVGEFIRKYNLDPGQQDAAQSILRELKARAGDYRESKKKEYGEVDQRLKEAFDSGDLKRRAAVEKEETALNKPINDMFSELKERLDKIPTSAQKERYAQSLNRKRMRPTPTSGPTSRPVLPIIPATQPARPAPRPPTED